MTLFSGGLFWGVDLFSSRIRKVVPPVITNRGLAGWVSGDIPAPLRERPGCAKKECWDPRRKHVHVMFVQMVRVLMVLMVFVGTRWVLL